MNSWDDIQLVSRVAVLHDRRAFDTLVKRHQETIRRFFLNQTCGDTQLSDDLAQETFIKAYTHIAGFHGMSGFQTWLFRIAYNVFLDYSRSHKATGCLTGKLPERAGKGADVGLRLDIYKCLELLKPEERLCVTLQLVEGQTIERVAEITGMPQGTVKSHLARGKSRLAKYLKENGYD